MEWLVVAALACFMFSLAFSVWYIDRPRDRPHDEKK